jgi:predicted NACHT family NTPase
LETLGIVCGYTGVRGNQDAFFDQVDRHLRKIAYRLVPLPAGEPARRASHADPTKYLRDLRKETAHIDIRGLQVGTGQANRFPIEQLYISLTTTGPAVRGKDERRRMREPGDAAELAEQRNTPLHKALQSDRLVVVGDPGAGKTTFLRRIAYALCQTQLGEVPQAAEERLGVVDRTFPVLVRISGLAEHLKTHAGNAEAPSGEVAAWLPHYLGSSGQGNSQRLNAGFFQRQLEDGLCTVLLDGLDEAPDRLLRERLSRLIENITRAYAGCRFVVTSRPAAYTGEVVLPEFAHATIDDLSDDAVDTFLTRWCQAVYRDSEASAQAHCTELLSAIRGRTEIRRMARNPVMLTALAVVHWNERRLPEQRADLYNSIITWLSRSREQRPGRETEPGAKAEAAKRRSPLPRAE